jgi:AcrR family transcriptional regulator
MWTVSTSTSEARDVDSVNISRYLRSVSTYHHGNLREELVRTAVALAREKGEEGVVLREVARRAGVSHNAAYRHFADRDELLAQVALAGLQELAAAMEQRLRGRGGGSAADRARKRLRELGRAYVHFALAEPGLFGVAFSCDPTGDPGGMNAYTLLGEALDGLVAAGVMDPAARPGAETVCWSAVHGFSMLHLDGPLRHSPDREREAELDRMLSLLERGLTGPA